MCNIFLFFDICKCYLFVYFCYQGKDLFMDLDEGALKLIDPENLTVLNTQPIHTIRVWGVGRDNGR
jgi:hypothetical protein